MTGAPKVTEHTIPLPPLPDLGFTFFCTKCGQGGDGMGWPHHRPHGPECGYMPHTEKQSTYPAAVVQSYASQAVSEALARKEGEVQRLREALQKANNQAEHFERNWYLRGDALGDLLSLYDQRIPLRERPETWEAALGEQKADSVHLAASLRQVPYTPPPEEAREPAPANSLPDWSECSLRVANSKFIAKRVAEGGYGAEPDSKLATQLHRFIYEYDDADKYRSAWFLHRLELLLKEERTPPPGYALVPIEFLQGFNTLAHNYSMRAEPPSFYTGTEGDAFSRAYARCGQDLARLRAMLSAAPSTALAGEQRP